jgi:diguanylate cyclase (GGDEF)-like protein/PAS domain S-box-containing protein
MNGPLHVLIVEDSPDDAELDQRWLRRAGFDLVAEVVDSAEALRQAIGSGEWDVVLTDHSLPSLSSSDVVDLLRGLDAEIPCIIVSGNIGEEAAVDALRAGAVDFVNKLHMGRLAPAVERALRETNEYRARQAAEARARASEARFAALVQQAADLIVVLSPDHRWLYVSPSVERVLGYTAEEVLQAERWIIGLPDAERMQGFLAEVVTRPGGSASAEFRGHHKDGTARWFDVTATNLLEDPSVGGIVLNARDITERKTFEDELRRRAFFDELTGLPNRALFLDRLGQSLLSGARLAEQVGLLAIDLDRFQVINDTFGHQVGDQTLVQVAARLRRCVRPTDTLARLGADEFALLVKTGGGPQDVISLAECVLGSFADPIQIGDQTGFVSTSVGVALAGPDTLSPDDLLRDADVALYQAKAAGRGGYAVFDPAMNDHTAERWTLGNDLRQAVGRGELRLLFQPLIELHSGRASGLEALVRWQHPNRGLLSPDAFLSLAEETGLIVPIGRWVLTEACRQVRDWQQRLPGAESLAVAVNFSARQVRQGDVVHDVWRVLEETGLSPSALELEITEQVLIEDLAAAARTLQALKSLGVRIAIDDFGTGYSSLNYVRRFSAGILKIDRSFAASLAPDHAERPLIGVMMNLARTLDMEVTVEGIETETQASVARDLGFDRAQGYYFARPLFPVDIETFLTRPPHPPDYGTSTQPGE